MLLERSVLMPPTGNTCSSVGLVPKIEQNFFFPLPVQNTIVCGEWGWGSVIQCPFPLSPNHLEGTRLFIRMHMSGATTEMLSTPQSDQSF